MTKRLLFLSLIVGLVFCLGNTSFASDDGQSHQSHLTVVGPRAGGSTRAPGSLTTLFASNNGYAGNMFDITPAKDIMFTGIDVNCDPTGATATVNVYWRDGTSVGHEGSSTGWNLLDVGTGVSAGIDQPTYIDLPGAASQTFLAGQVYGIYVSLDYPNVMCWYTNGGPKTYSNADLSLTTNTGNASPEFGSFFFPRQWNGTIYYDDGGPAMPRVDVKVNGEDANVIVYEGTPVQISVDVRANSYAGVDVDIFKYIKDPSGTFWTYHHGGGHPYWTKGYGADYTGPLADMNGIVFDNVGPIGVYKTFCFIDDVPNGIPDLSNVVASDMVDVEIKAAPRIYSYDDGSTENLLAWTSGGDMCWLHRFNAYVGGETITEIHAIWGSAMYPGYNPGNGTPATVYVWDDPTEDGDPNDAVLVATEPTTVQNVDTDIYNIIPLTTPPTIVDEFYFGAMQTHSIGQYVAPIDQTTPYVWGNGFFCGTNTAGGFDPANLGGNQYPPAEWGNYWCVRAGY